MQKPELPLLVEPTELLPHLDNDRLLVVDLSIPSAYKDGHVPGAISLRYPEILHQHDDVDCDMPPDEKVSEVLSRIGITPEHHVVAYDAQSNPMASRFIWTLEEVGFKNHSLLNGGWKAWFDAGLPVDRSTNEATPCDYRAKRTGQALATKDDILHKLGDKNTVLLDTRMAEEFTNELLMTDRGGHIPGAVHYDWDNSYDKGNSDRFHPEERVLGALDYVGATKDKDIIVYCQSHLRSAHTYVVLKWLGYENVKAYAAGYSEWGNDTETPIANELKEDCNQVNQVA